MLETPQFVKRGLQAGVGQVDILLLLLMHCCIAGIAHLISCGQNVSYWAKLLTLSENKSSYVDSEAVILILLQY